MNHDEFAFFNRQLAAMTRDGIPLEGALKQLSRGMRSGPLRAEVEALEKDLAAGEPLAKAIDRRKFPDLYRRLLRVGAAGNDLPGALTLIADHFDRTHALWTRLKGLMVYPALVILVSLVVTGIASVLLSRFLTGFTLQPPWIQPPASLQGEWLLLSVWAPPILLAAFAGAVLALVASPRGRGWLRWRLPGFREASLAQLGSALSLLVKHGTPLPEALALAEGLEQNTPAAAGLAQWRAQTEKGQGTPAQWEARPPLPALFLWLVRQAGPDVASGFEKASELYGRRAAYRIEMMLYGALPVSILLLAQMVIWQAVPLLQSLVWMMNTLGDVGM